MCGILAQIFITLITESKVIRKCSIKWKSAIGSNIKKQGNVLYKEISFSFSLRDVQVYIPFATVFLHVELYYYCLIETDE